MGGEEGGGAGGGRRRGMLSHLSQAGALPRPLARRPGRRRGPGCTGPPGLRSPAAVRACACGVLRWERGRLSVPGRPASAAAPLSQRRPHAVRRSEGPALPPSRRRPRALAIYSLRGGMQCAVVRAVGGVVVLVGYVAGHIVVWCHEAAWDRPKRLGATLRYGQTVERAGRSGRCPIVGLQMSACIQKFEFLY